MVGKGGKPLSAKRGNKAVARQLPRPPAPSTPVGWAASRQPPRSGGTPAGTAGGKRATPKPRSKSPGRESEADRHAELLAAIANLGAQVADVSLRVTHLVTVYGPL